MENVAITKDRSHAISILFAHLANCSPCTDTGTRTDIQIEKRLLNKSGTIWRLSVSFGKHFWCVYIDSFMIYNDDVDKIYIQVCSQFFIIYIADACNNLRILCFWINFRLFYAWNNFNEELLYFGEKCSCFGCICTCVWVSWAWIWMQQQLNMTREYNI